MSEPNTVVQLTSVELAEGTIKSVTVPGEGGVEQTVQIRIPPGVADGTLLRIPVTEGDHYVRISLEPTPPPEATPPPDSATPPSATPQQDSATPPLATPPPGLAAPSLATPPPDFGVLPSATPPPGFAAPPLATPPPGFAAPPLAPPPAGFAISPPATPPPGFAVSPSATPPAGFGVPPASPAFGPSARSRRRIVLLTGVAAAVVVIVVALITGISGPATSGTPTPQAAPPAPTTTTQPPESAADYQQGLNGLATALNNGLTELNNAQTPEAITTAVTDLGNDIQQAEGAFDAVPPTAIATENDALLAALHAVTGEGLIAVSSAASSDQVCLGSSATALLSRAIGLDQLRQAITTLTAAGYQFGASIPPITQDGARTAGTGAIVAGGVKHGLGQLTITNGGDTDATVGIVAGQGAPLVTVYMGHGGTFTLHHIPDGTYTIYVTSGADWDGGARLFSRNCDFEQFDQTMDFTTTSTQYTTYTITLTPVAGGNASESSVDPGSFPH